MIGLHFYLTLANLYLFTLFSNKGGEFTPDSLIPNLRGSYISNLSLLIYLESYKKVPVVGGGWMGGVLM